MRFISGHNKWLFMLDNLRCRKPSKCNHLLECFHCNHASYQYKYILIPYMKKQNKFYFTKWKFQSEQFDDILRVKAKTAISRLFTKFRLIAGGSLSIRFVKEAQVLAIKLSVIRRDQGIKGLTLFLKTSSVCLQQSLAGYCIENVTLVGPRISRTKSGLPRIICRSHRLLMINRLPGCYLLMKYYLSIFYLYRVLSFPGVLKLETITDPGKEYEISTYRPYMEKFSQIILQYSKVSPLEYMRKSVRIFPIFRSSPFTSVITYNPFKKVSTKRTSLWSTNVISLTESVRAIMSNHLFPLFNEFLNDIMKFHKLSDFLRYQKGMKVDDESKLSGPVLEWSRSIFKYTDRPFLRPLGKLGQKEEAAGKVRVFAMVDPITQWILNPLHKWIFSILRRLPMDGTFNQLRPIHRLLKMSKVKGLYSLDLSAATDRLPVSLQGELLNHLVKEYPGFGTKWATLLTDRDYSIKLDKDSMTPTIVRYAVGQPMGALSSWGMLALIHHFIVQVAAWKCGHPSDKLFKSYAVLGDDLVIADHRVMKSYLRILKDLGVKCGLHKSILSPKGIGLEFAKTTFVDKQNVSPISLDELSVSLQDLSTWSAFSSKFKLGWERQMHILGFGYLARRKSFKKMNHALQLLFMSQIAKADFNTESLKLGMKHNPDFDGLFLDVFKIKVLFPLFQRLINQNQRYSKWLKHQLSVMNEGVRLEHSDYDKYDLRNAFDLVIGRAHTDYPNKLKELSLKYIHDMDSESLSALLFFNFNERVFLWLWPYLKVNTFNDALQLYFNLNSELGKLSLDIYGLEKGPNRLPSTKLPIQAKLFRDWSLASHKVISTYRASLTETNK